MNTLGVTISICSSLLAWSVAVHAAPATDALPADSLHRIEGEFQDHRGRATSLAAASGPTTLLAMFYATCPMACPMLIADIKRVVGALTPEERVEYRGRMISESTESRYDDGGFGEPSGSGKKWAAILRTGGGA